MGWANRITVARALVTAGVWALITYGSTHGSPSLWWWCFGLFTFAAITDVVDGALARGMGDVSMFGRIADPLVDKMLTIGTLIVLLAAPHTRPWLPAWMVATIFTREILVTAVRGQIEGTGVNFQAISWGKYKMLLQCCAIGGLLLCGAGVGWVRDELPFLAWLPGPAGTWNLTHAMVWLAMLLTVASGVVYALRARDVLRAHD